MDHPSEVALLSMREQARKAGVPPATMTRLAQRLGFSGFMNLKAAYAEFVRNNVAWFSGRAVTMLSRRREIGEAALVTETVDVISRSVAELNRPATAKHSSKQQTFSKRHGVYFASAHGRRFPSPSSSITRSDIIGTGSSCSKAPAEVAWI